MPTVVDSIRKQRRKTATGNDDAEGGGKVGA